MENKNSFPAKLFVLIGAAAGWFAVVFQLYLMMQNSPSPLPEKLIRFFSFFTILTNIISATCFAALLINKRQSFLTKNSTLTAVAVYILVVGLIYNLILRQLWTPEGWQRLVDELLHSVIPAWFFLYWLFFVPKENIVWKNILPGLIYPAVYCIYILIRGKISGEYPYPFMDVISLGYNKVLINICGVILVFLVIFILLTGIAKIISSRNKISGHAHQ